MLKNPGLVTIIISALFGGLASSILTQHFFEQRERRRILLEKYEQTIRTIQDTQTRLKDYYGFLEPRLRELKHGTISDNSFSSIEEFEKSFRKNYFQLIDQISLIHIVSYYDNHFEIVSTKYYSKSWEFIDEISILLSKITNRDYPTIENFYYIHEELDIVANVFMIELQHRIKKLMQPPFWGGVWQPPK